MIDFKTLGTLYGTLEADGADKMAKSSCALSLDDIIDRVLLLVGRQSDNYTTFVEEADRMAKILFSTYRAYISPPELLTKFIEREAKSQPDQYQKIMVQWFKYYPEDFTNMIEINVQEFDVDGQSIRETATQSHESTCCSSSTDSDCSGTGFELQLSIRRISSISSLGRYLLQGTDNVPIPTGSHTGDETPNQRKTRSRIGKLSSKSNGYNRGSNVLEMDSRFIALQLNSMDIENLIHLRPHKILEDTKSDPHMRTIVRNFNLLSRHVVLSILQSHQPSAATVHWISVCMHLRRLNNFNSLKAIVAGLTNESIYRLRITVWSRLRVASRDAFISLASEVDDINNQTTLRKNQLDLIGHDSKGGVPYLGVYLTDLNFINARYSKYKCRDGATSAKRLINFERCMKQFEVLQTIQLFQEKMIQHLIPLNGDSDEIDLRKKIQQAMHAMPRTSRVFENWFFNQQVMSTTDKEW